MSRDVPGYADPYTTENTSLSATGDLPWSVKGKEQMSTANIVESCLCRSLTDTCFAQRNANGSGAVFKSREQTRIFLTRYFSGRSRIQT
tara:strand:+ start:446 stop:712 length:267 start_codon:yes stop_codon:yes gene_type:complete